MVGGGGPDRSGFIGLSRRGRLTAVTPAAAAGGGVTVVDDNAGLVITAAFTGSFAVSGTAGDTGRSCGLRAAAAATLPFCPLIKVSWETM